jgi:hypothetical protein
MFWDRISGDLSPNRLTLALRQRGASGNPIIDLTESNPTRVELDYPADRPLGPSGAKLLGLQRNS